jgi:hypothetical protein
MIRQPEFVTDSVFAAACDIVGKKKPHLDLSKASLNSFTEGLCVQCMHHGSYDDEPLTLSKMKSFMSNNDLSSDITDFRRHHEIYLSDPRKIVATKMRTVLRLLVKN